MKRPITIKNEMQKIIKKILDKYPEIGSISCDIYIDGCAKLNIFEMQEFESD